MLQIPHIYNLSKIFKSSPSVVQHLQCSLIVNQATRNNLQWNVNQNTTIYLNRMPLKMSQAKYQPFYASRNMLTNQTNYVALDLGK